MMSPNVSTNDPGVSVFFLSVFLALCLAALESKPLLWSAFICLTLLRVSNKLVRHNRLRNVLEA